MSKSAIVPAGCWPARMPPEIAAGYVGERTMEAFLRLVGPGKEYPLPVVDEGSGKGRRRLWLKTDLDKAIGIANGGEDPEPY